MCPLFRGKFKEELGDPALIRDFVISPRDSVGLEFSIAPDKTTWSGQLIAQPKLLNDLDDVFQKLRLLSTAPGEAGSQNLQS